MFLAAPTNYRPEFLVQDVMLGSEALAMDKGGKKPLDPIFRFRTPDRFERPAASDDLRGLGLDVWGAGRCEVGVESHLRCAVAEVRGAIGDPGGLPSQWQWSSQGLRLI